jgi:HD superfamily phosphohydrolase
MGTERSSATHKRSSLDPQTGDSAHSPIIVYGQDSSANNPLSSVSFVPSGRLRKDSISIQQSFSWNELSTEELLNTINQELGLKPVVTLSKAAEEIIATSDFQRLTKIRQLSINYTAFGMYSDHSRAVHCIVAYVHGKALAQQCGLSEKDTEICGLICLLHDIGHLAFQHIGESFFNETKTYQGFSHDAFANEVIRTREIGKILAEHDFPVPLICDTICSDKATVFNDIKECADRSSYLCVDTINSPFSDNFKAFNKFAFNRIRNDCCIIDNRLVFSDIFTPLLLINYRHELFKNFSCSPASALVRECIKNILHSAVKEQIISPEHLLYLGDQEIIDMLPAEHQNYFACGFDQGFRSYMAWIVPENRRDPQKKQRKLPAPVKVKDRLRDFLYQEKELRDFAFVCVTEGVYKSWDVGIRDLNSQERWSLKSIVNPEDSQAVRYLFIAVPSDEPPGSPRLLLLEKRVAQFYEEKWARRNPRAFVNPETAARSNIINSFANPSLIDPGWLEFICIDGKYQTLQHFNELK